MAHRILRIAPLTSLPATRSVFDYAYRGDVVPPIGSVIEIPFRSKQEFGLVVSHPEQSSFKLREITAEQIHPLLTSAEVTFLDHVSEQLHANIGSLALHMLPPIGKRTVQNLAQRTPAPLKKNPSSLSYVWYRQHNSITPAILQIIQKIKRSGPIIITAPTTESAQAIALTLRSETRKTIHVLHGASAPERRTVWNTVITGASDIIIGTHLTIWTPHHPSITHIIIDPTHHAHTQWIIARYTHREILEIRRQFLHEQLFIIAHSPDTVDLDRISTIPEMHAWPVIIDRALEDPAERASFVSPYILDKLTHARNILFFVPHLRESTHTICKDCGFLYKTEHAPLSCTSCASTTFRTIGYGAKTVVKELQSAHVCDAHDSITLLDTEEYKNISLKAPASTDSSKEVVIATVPLHTRLDLSLYDVVIDLSVDFELLHPEYDSEETLWKRIRATATHIPQNWHGSWYIQTRKSELKGLKIRSTVGFFDWWNPERMLRQRFHQPPFAHLDFKRNM